MIVSISKAEKDFRKIFAVGDIHGMAGNLEKLLSRIPVDFERDLLVFLGDYIDRGPYSREVIELLLDISRKTDNVVFLKGNHEQMLMDFLNGADPVIYFWNGGRSTIESYGFEELPGGRYNVFIPEGHINFFSHLPVYLETENYIFVHAGLRPGVPLHNQTEEDLLWIRHEFIYSNEDFGKKVIFGHTPFYSPFVMDNKIGIDTGAVYGRYLTCVQLPDEEFIFEE